MSNETTTETPPTAAVTVVENPKQLVEVANKNQLEPVTAEQLFTAYRPFFTEVNRLLEDAKRVNVTDATQVMMITHARDLRLKLRKQRTEADKVREALKADSLRRSKAIDGMFNVLKLMTEPIEEKLLAAEEFAERAEAERIQKLETERKNLLRPFAPTVDHVSGYGTMEEADFQKMFAGLKLAHEQGEAAKKKEAEDRAAKEKAIADERERVRQENEKLRKEAEDREADRLRKLSLHNERVREASKRSILLPPGHYGELSDEEFSTVLNDLEAKVLALKKLEEERAAAEKRREEAKAEHDRKMKEAQEKTDREIAEIRRQNEEKAAAEKKKRDDEAAAERQQREAAEAERQKKINAEMAEMRRKAKADADAKKKLEEEADQRRLADFKRREKEDEIKIAEEEKARVAAAAPFAEQLRTFANGIRNVQLPNPPRAADHAIRDNINRHRINLCDWIEAQANALTNVLPTL